MTEVDVILKPIKISYEGNLDFNEIYKLVKKFLSEKKYDIDEKEHNYSDSGPMRIKWEATQNINDYTQFQLEVTIKSSSVKKVKLNKKDVLKGKFDVSIEAKINKDYQNYYANKPLIKFFRELFDYTTKKEEFNALGKQLKNEAYSLYDEIKSYFGMQKLQ